MTPCEIAQLDLEKRLHQKLSEAEDQQLEAHLRSCADCRRFSKATKEVDDMFSLTTQHQVSQLTPGKLEKHLWASLRTNEQRPLRVGLAFLLFLPVAWLWLESSPLGMMAFSLLGLTLFFVAIALSHARARALIRLVDIPEAFIPFQRHQLERSISAYQVTRVVFFLGGLLQLLKGWSVEDTRWSPFYMILGLGLMVSGVLAHRALNKARRERRELD